MYKDMSICHPFRSITSTMILVGSLFVFGLPVALQAKDWPEAGVNIISVGNTYGDLQFQDEPLDTFFSALKTRGISRISLRVTWTTMQREDGTLNPDYLASMKRIYEKAHAYGFKAMLDFHTLFMKDCYACPDWVADYEQDDGSPCVRSVAMLARSKAVRERYLLLIAGVLSELKDCQAIDVVSVMNEPFSLEWKNPSKWDTDLDTIQTVIEDAARIVRKKAPGRRVAVRFCGEANPWSHEPNRRFDADRLLKTLDIIGQNVYLNPNDDNAANPGKITGQLAQTLSWEIISEAAEHCRSAGKTFWITEFGAPWRGERKGDKGSPEFQREYFEGYCKRFWGDAIRPETIMAWVISLNPKEPDINGLYDGASGTFRPAFDVYTTYMLSRKGTANQTIDSDKK